MANTSDYKFTAEVQTFKTVEWLESETVKGFYVETQIENKGIMCFGANGGVLTEDKLTPSIVEWLLSKQDGEGQFMYVHLLEKKSKKDK